MDTLHIPPKDRTPNILPFRVIETEEEKVPKVLTHLSISIHPTGIRVKSEVGLDEYLKTFQTKQQVLDYLDGVL